MNYEVFVFSNQVKKYSFNADFTAGTVSLFSGKSYTLILGNNFRFTDKFSIGQTTTFTPEYNNAGYTDIDTANNDDIIFSRRNRNTIENILNLKYNFNKNSGITLRARHYWSRVDGKELFTLQPDGSLIKNYTFTGNGDQNFNLFNIDMVYTWQFAPGSFINIVWKNAIYNDDPDVSSSYFKNLGTTLGSSQNNNLSLKVIYYLDYLQLKKKR